jgi:predicted amidophosphoribosyltransferase
MSVATNPRLRRGPWTDGYALDFHTLQSTFLGHDSYGHPRFDTTRPPVGDLLYRLKYKNDQTAIAALIEAIMAFWENWNPPVQAIVPVPPSNAARKNQPVTAVAMELAKQLGIPLCTACITKAKRTPELKDVFDYDKRMEALKDAFTVQPAQTGGKNLLLFDDLYRSGATVSAITELLKSQGKAKAVYLLTLTETRRTV